MSVALVSGFASVRIFDQRLQLVDTLLHWSRMIFHLHGSKIVA
jgi:hypothetical protein